VVATLRHSATTAEPTLASLLKVSPAADQADYARFMGDLGSPQFDKHYGRGQESLFPNNETKVVAPFPSAGRSKKLRDFDQSKVTAALSSPPALEDVDTRGLKASQPWVTGGGVSHYMGEGGQKYAETGETYADKDNPGNKYPVIYHRRNSPEESTSARIILSGHHRATAAHLEGKPLRGIVVHGGWGDPR
jgi:hypothetical protein